jgi:hypothetical protein
MTLSITITDAGRAELIQNSHLGFNAVTIVAVAVGDAQYAPTRTQTALQNEVARLASIAGNAVGDGILHVTARDESAAAYDVGEFGLITDKGTLFAVYSQPAAAGWIIQKAAPSIMLLATDVLLEDIEAEQIQFGDVVFLNPPATTDMAGVVELADDAEAAAAEDNRRSLTPRGARKFLDADTTKEPAIALGNAAQFWRGDKTWADLATAVRAAVLTGLSTATATAVAATDTLLVALGKLQAQVTSLGTNKLDKTATAAAATKLATARTINGVNFDGSANISISAPANGGTSAACSGNAATATKLATARTINGVAFDGSANISISAAATPASVMSAIAGAGLGDVGTYALLSPTAGNGCGPGELRSGSVLRYSSGAASTVSTPAPPGTWMCMGRAQDSGAASVFLRIS